MLRYDVKLDYDNLKRDVLVWGERFVAPDLSFVSGVTSQHYHVEKNDVIAASIGGDTNFASLNIECENVTRNGYVLITGKEYKIETGRTTANQAEFKYIYVNGVYYYITGDTVTIHNHLKEQWEKINGEYKAEIVEGDVTGTVEGNVVKLDTIAWIEDDTVEIDGNKYIYDKYDEGLKYYPAGRTLSADEVTYCDGMYYNYFESESDYLYVTKFKLTKKEDKTLEFDRLSYCTYFYYVLYKGYYCPIRKTENGFVCDIPTRLINGDSEDDTATTEEVTDMSGNAITITRISQLKSTDAIVTIEGTKFPVEYILQNSNYGDELAVYLTDGSNNISIGDIITLTHDVDDTYDVPVYSFEDEEFVLFNNVKYYLEDDIADTVTINNVEYDVSYPNGTDMGVDALVNIDGDMIPMKITDEGLERYGLIVLRNELEANTARYSVNKYEGVRMNGKIYRVYADSEGSSKSIEMSEPTPYKFIIDSIEGSSLLICTPSFNTSEFSDEFIDSICAQICDFFISRQNNVKVVSENRAFGTRVLDSNIGYSIVENPSSSNDYYNAAEALTLFVNSGYIQVQFPLSMNVALNGMQEDTVKRDFYDTEKKKAINPIVDMEKDVYAPKYIPMTDEKDGYVGSKTDFSPINKIEINLHFRTRELEKSWKVNDGNNNISVSGYLDNWFCTDFFPYNKILELPEDNGGINTQLKDTLMGMSDLMDFLWFTNDDIYYQRDKVGKSFLRFSYYDSPDPNTQSLLATSTVFMDEHALYKKYIDYSRRNINNFGLVKPGITYHEDMTMEETTSSDVINRISVESEYLGEKGKKTVIKTYDIDYITDRGKIGDDIRNSLKDDSKRLSSKFIIDNKYATDTSSEGFYLYIFREYSENLHPKPIYMKIEFNHAGVGRTIPFIVPMHWTGSTDNPNEMFPDRRLTLHGDDLDELKGGYPLSFVYAQTYIPLYAVYDFKNKEYAYVFDDRYVTIDNDSKLTLNLFELKVATEDEATDQDRADVRNNNITRAVINVSSQFDNKPHESDSEENQP